MMMVDNEDLGLSLSLTCSKPNINRVNTSGSNRNLSPIQLNLSSSSLSHANLPFALAWNDSVASSPADRASDAPCRAIGGGSAAAEARSFLIIGINANRQQAIAEDEEAGVSSPNSTISSVSGKRSEREAACAAVDEQDVDRTCSRGASDEEDGDASRKKLRLSKDQSAVLEDSFKDNHTLNPKQKMALAKRLGLRPRQVEVWFQNRRARTKLKQTEFDCEFMRKCCEQLTEENRRLQKEVQELRALKLSPQFYMPMAPPTTLTVCPSCERVAPPSSAPAPAHAQRRLPANPWGVQIGQVES